MLTASKFYANLDTSSGCLYRFEGMRLPICDGIVRELLLVLEFDLVAGARRPDLPLADLALDGGTKVQLIGVNLPCDGFKYD